MGKRFRNYFKRSYITSLKNIMLVYKAILAHGYSNFSLEILEYCEPDKIIILEREQYYLDLVFWIFLWASPKKKKENPNTIS
jgi:group I intron endonuclease